MSDKEKVSRTEYQREYYQANRDRISALRKLRPTTQAQIDAQIRYREKIAIFREIQAMKHGPIGECGE